jgi:hypothetical protein
MGIRTGNGLTLKRLFFKHGYSEPLVSGLLPGPLAE